MVSAGLGITMMGKSTLIGYDLDLKTIELENISHKLDMKLVWKKDRFEQLRAYYRLLEAFLDLPV